MRHPDQALVLRTRVILPLVSSPDEVGNRSEHLVLIHVIRAEELTQDPASKAATAK